MSVKTPLRYLRLNAIPILRQLQIEEALFRMDATHASKPQGTENYFIYNDRTPEPAIVMGIGGKPELLIDEDAAKLANVPIIKRYTGGGTVVVDHNTIFTTFICSSNAFPHVLPYPREIMKWSETIYKPFFQRLYPTNSFCLQEEDYVFGTRKCGGNAQSISRGRWVHHTSFLWNFSKEKMKLLLHPQRQPKYREQRDHNDFLISLQSVIENEQKKNGMNKSGSIDHFALELRKEMENWFDVEDISISDISDIIAQPHHDVLIETLSNHCIHHHSVRP